MSDGPLDPHKSLLHPEREIPGDDVSRVTPVKRRRLLNLVDLRVPGGTTSPGLEFGGASPCLPSLSHPVGVLNASSSLGHGRRSRTPLTDLDSKFVTKSGLCGSLDIGDGVGSIRGNTGLKITHLTASTGMPVVNMGGSTLTASRDDTVPRFPRLDQCAHFHYEYVELPPIQVALVSEELKPLSSQGGCTGEESENRSLLVQVASLGRSWVVRRTYDNFRFLDKQLHRCCYDRKFSQLKELPPEENFPGDEKEAAIETTLRNYLRRFSEVAGSLITCGPVLGWFELDNRGHRLIVTDDSDINTPAVAAAYVTKRYTAQASDEISFEVGDMISVIDMPPPEESIWWRGKRGFQVGFFPCECVQVIGEKGPQAIHPQALTLPPTRSSSTPPLGPGHHNPLQASSSVGSSQEPIKPVLRKHGKLIAFFRSFILSRPSRRRLKQSGILRERVFGCDLGEHLLNSGHEIPMVLKCCAEFIESHGTVDGIYRLSGITSNIQKLRNAFDEERVPELYGDESILQDIHCVSSVLKMYFRELPNPLLTYQLYDKFVTAVMESEDVRLLHVRDVVQQLPPPHYRTLEYLIQHLARIASHSSDTGMTPRNIAIVWAPNLLRSKDLEKGGVAALQDVGTQAVVTEYLVHYVDLIFNDKIPLFSPTNGFEGTPKKSRPKSLAISTPAKLLSIDEARNKALAAIKSDQKYIEVGGGPRSLPKTYHTVIDLPSRKGGSLKQKKSPLGWKTLFTKNRHQRKASTPTDLSLNISDPVVMDSDIGNHASKRLRPVKSVESLVSTPVSLQSNRNSQVCGKLAMKQEGNPLIPRERKGSISSECSSIPSPRTHNRSVSHDSYFNLLERSGSNASPSEAVKEERETDNEMSPENSSKIFLDISELNLEFNTSEAEMKIFSEDETLKSTSVEDTLSRSTVDIEENISISSDIAKSKESVSSREKKSLKEKLRKRFKSPSSQRKDTAMSDSSEDSRSNSLKRASSVIKDKLVQALSPEMSRKKVEGISNHLQHTSSPMNTPKQQPKAFSNEQQEKKPQKATTSPISELSIGPFSNVDMMDEKPIEVDLNERASIESALIDPELLEKITRMRVSPSVSASEVSSVSLAEATVSDNESFAIESSPNTGSNGAEIKGTIFPDNSGTFLQSLKTTPYTPPVTVVPDSLFQQEIYKRERSRCSREEEEREQQKRTPKSKTAKDRPNSLLGIPVSTESCGLGSALTSPETPQGDSTFIEIQYHPLSDTTEPSTPSESHFVGNLEEHCSLSILSCPNDLPPRPSSPLSPDLSSSSTDDPIENGPLYENIEVTSLSLSKFANFDNLSSKVSPEVDTPTAEGSEMEYENIQYNTLEQSFLDEDNSRLAGSSSVTPSYENLSKEFLPLRESRQDSSTEDIITAYENIATPGIRGENEPLSKIDVEDEYEYYSFKNEPNYENVAFAPDKEVTPSEKTEAEIQGEVVYQQVKYLRRSIQEVNEILNEEIKMSNQPPPILESKNLSLYQAEVVEEEVKRESREVTPDIYASEGSECLDSPVTPSSSSLVTEVLVLPSFSSPTESTTEDAMSPDASESRNSPKQPPNYSISYCCTESPTTAKSPPNSLTSFIPTLSPPSPDVTGVVPLAVTLTSNRTLGTTLAPSPWPRSGHKLGQVWPPIPKPRNLPSLSTVSSHSTQNTFSHSPLTAEYCAEDPSPTEELKAFESPPSQPRNVVHIVQVPPDDCRNLLLEKGDRMEDDSNIESAYSAVKFPEEDNAQKRERIEKYKEERRSFLREKYKSESFKGEKDDMLLRLKQKATSPNRQDDANESLEYSGPDPDDDFPFNPCVNVFDNSECERVEPAAERSSAPSMTSHLRFQSSDNSSCMKPNPDSVVRRSESGGVVKVEPLNRSNSQECNVFSEGHVQKAKEVCSLSSTANVNPRIQTQTLSESSSENRDEDINVKERVAIWNRHEVTSLTPTQKGDCRSTPPPKLQKVQDSTSTITDSKLPTKVTKISSSKTVTMSPKHGEDTKINASYSSIGHCRHFPQKGSQINGAMVREFASQAQIHKENKNKVVSPKTTTASKATPQAIATRPILVTQKSESDLREPVMLKARSYSIGSGLGTSGSTPRAITAHQKSIKDMKALFEARDSTTQEVNRRVVIRPTSRDWIGK